MRNVTCFLSVDEFRLIGMPNNVFNEPVTGSADPNVPTSENLLGVPFAICENFLSSSSELINSALRTHHDVPLEGVPEENHLPCLKRACNIITSFELCNGYLGLKPDDNPAIESLYVSIVGNPDKHAKGYLDRLREGTEIIDELSSAIDSTPQNFLSARCDQPVDPMRHFITLRNNKGRVQVF